MGGDGQVLGRPRERASSPREGGHTRVISARRKPQRELKGPGQVCVVWKEAARGNLLSKEPRPRQRDSLHIIALCLTRAQPGQAAGCVPAGPSTGTLHAS